MNGRAFIAALLIFLTGLVLTGLLSRLVAEDLRFIFCSRSQLVVIKDVDYQLEKVGDPVHATSSLEAKIYLKVVHNERTIFLNETYINNEKVVFKRLEDLQRRSGQVSELWLCDQFPSRFALESKIPWKGLSAVLLAFLVLVLPAGGAMIHYIRKEKKKK